MKDNGEGVGYQTLSLITQAGSAVLTMKHAQDCQVPIILAAMAIESFFNELADCVTRFAQENEPEAIVALGQILTEAEAANAQVSLKYTLTHFALTGKAINRGGSPFQDFALLVRVRNALVHSKPTPYSMNPTPENAHSLIKQLIARGILEKEVARKRGPSTRYILSPAVSIWAYETAWNVVEHLVSLFPEGGSVAPIVRAVFDGTGRTSLSNSDIKVLDNLEILDRLESLGWSGGGNPRSR
jgi:hypothetical protein